MTPVDVRTCTVADLVEWALEVSADDPDARHPEWVRECLDIARRGRWSARTDPARELATVQRMASNLEVRCANLEASRAPVQLGLVLDDVTGSDPHAAPSLMLALSVAYRRLGRMPTRRDVQRRRVGLPPLEEFEAVGGFTAAVRRFRSELGVVA